MLGWCNGVALWTLLYSLRNKLLVLLDTVPEEEALDIPEEDVSADDV